VKAISVEPKKPGTARFPGAWRARGLGPRGGRGRRRLRDGRRACLVV